MELILKLKFKPFILLRVQKRQAQANPKSTSEKYNPQEDGGAGFPIEPSGLQTGMHAPGIGSTWYDNKGNHGDHRTVPGRTYSSVRVSNGPQLQSQRSYVHQPGGTDFIMPARTTANSRYNRLDVAEPCEKQVLDRPASSHKKDLGIKDTSLVSTILLTICSSNKHSISNKFIAI